MSSFSTLKVSRLENGIVQVELNRPRKANAMNKQFWLEMRQCFKSLATDGNCRVVLLKATHESKVFTAGLDLNDLPMPENQNGIDSARIACRYQTLIKELQESFTVIEKCPQPVIACVSGACIGAGVDMISACDIRLCTEDTWFSIKEVDIGLAADVGTLQRMPKIVGNDSIIRELVYTGRPFNAKEALNIGFIGSICKNKVELYEKAMHIARSIASKSPVAIAGSKHNLIYSRDHSVLESLDHMAIWNGSMLQTKDMVECMRASAMKQSPTFSKL